MSARPLARPAEAPTRPGWGLRRPPDALLAIITPIGLLLLWELLVRANVLDFRFFPPPSRIATAAGALVANGELLVHVKASLYRIVLGFAIGAAIGIPVGLALGSFRILRVMFDPILSALYVIPKIAILPLIMLIFGLGEGSKIAIVALATFFVVAINSLAGVRQVEPILIEAGRNFGARGLQMFRHVIFPGALPSIFTGQRLGAGTALLVIIAAEFVAANEGIGFLIWRSWTTLVTENMFVGFVVIAALGTLSTWLLHRVGRLVMPWQADELDLVASRRENA
ncbi:MAG: ABC transporter permease [Chloroflexi bacterium]|nr:ABC transporter permease [Chloroflexota bacterium]